MEFELIRVSASLALLAAASYYDLFNRKNVPVAIPYAMIVIGFLLNLATLDFSLILWSSATALAIFGAGYIVYKTGQIGGADVLVFAGIALLLPEFPQPLLQEALPGQLFSYPFVVSVFLLSGFLAIIGLSLKHIPLVSMRLLKGEARITAQSAFSAATIILSYIVVLYFFLQAGILSGMQASVLLAVVLMAGFLTLFKESISASMVQWVKFKEIDEEDVISLPHLNPKLVSKLRLQPVLTPPELAKLKKSRLKKFPIFKGMPPFLPYVFLAALAVILFGDPIWLLFT